MLRSLLLIITVSCYLSSWAQEVIAPAATNAQIIQRSATAAISKTTKKRGETPPLTLPFIDDFAYSDVFPSGTLWADSSVYVNTGYGLRPITVGVATFDALDKNGTIHTSAGYDKTFGADTLLSQPINLLPADNEPLNPATVFLSFYYQPQGLGDYPNEGDSLKLEFYAPLTDTWTKVWGVAGSLVHDFKAVILPVSESKYLQKEFRFRFTNKASLSGTLRPSLVSNGDQWNIDYVYLNKDRTAKDTTMHDLAFQEPIGSMIKEYQAMPWTHFKTNPQKFLNDKLYLVYNNLDNKNRLIDSTIFYFADQRNSEVEKWDDGAKQLFPRNAFKDDWTVLYDIAASDDDLARFDLSVRIVTDNYDYVPNNTLSRSQTFADYYAYDDESAEGGYGLRGESTKNGLVAYRFVNHKSGDKIVAVDMFFNQVLYEASRKYFILKIWNSEGGMPGSEIYSQIGLRPEYSDAINKFNRFMLDETVALPDTFYVGWQKTTTEMLNVGWDVNNNTSKHLYYNIFGNWEQSAMSGSLMLHPVFESNITASIEAPAEQQLKIWPNPAGQLLNIETNNPDLRYADLYSMSGQCVRHFDLNEGKQLSLEGVNAGIYILRVGGQNQVLTTKLVVQ